MMEKVKKMDQLIKFLVVFSILLSHIPIDMVYAEEISQSNNTVESNRQESEQVMNHPLERNNPLVQLIANPPEGGNPQQFVSPTPTGSIPGIMARPNVNWRFVKWEISSSIGVSVNDVYAESSLITVQGAGEAVIQAIYERIPGGIVTVRHVDESGNEIANTVLLNGYQGESYTAEAKNISGWELMTTPQNAAGTFTGVDQTVVFTYKRIPAGEVLVKYVDESGNDVAESATLTGYYGDTYTAEAKTIEGWELITVPDNVSGTFSDTGQTVVFVYQRQLSLWGTVPWDYDEVSKTITLYGGVAGLVDAASWKLPSMATEFIVVKETVVLPANSGQLFMGASNLRAIEGANKFDTSSVTHMNWMFGNASSLESLDLNQWDTSSVIDMTAMFNGTSSLKELAIENFDTSKVTNIDYLQNFLQHTAESHSGTFMQKGLMEGQRLLLEQSRPEAEKMFIHIGNDSANRSYLPAENATVYPNTGKINDYNGYHTSSYTKAFQTANPQYHTTSKTSTDSLAVPVSSQVVTDEILGTIVDIKESNFTVYSVATAPSARGEYIARNLATAPANYLTTDENLSGLGSALKEIANHIDKTIPNGTITDPMGEGILLQGAGTFDNSHYQLVGWCKNDQGAWIQAPEIVAAVQVTEANQTISISNIALGENEKLTLTYQVRINTESAEFQGETWVLCNGRTTLTTGSDGEYLDFPIPSIKAPVVELKIMKKWVNVPDAEIPDQIEYQVKRTTTVSAESWQMSDSLTLDKGEGYQGTRTKVPVEGQNVVLPKYNNQGEDFFYTVEEVNVPDDFESAVTNEDGTIIITNTKKETSSTTEPSTTEPSTTEPSTTEPSTTEPSVTEPSVTEPSTTEPSTMEPSTTEPSVTEPSVTEPSTTEPNTTDSSMLGTQNNQSESSYSAALNASNKTNDKKLPQTNDEKASWMLVLGIMIVSVIGGTIIIRMK